MAVRHISVADDFTFDEGAPYTGNLLANDYDADGDPLSLVALNGIAISSKQAQTQIAGTYGVFTMQRDGTFSYRLNDGIVLNEGDTLIENMKATVWDADGKTISGFKLTIVGRNEVVPNAAPVAQDASFSGRSAQTITGKAIATDANLDPLSFTLATGPAHGVVTVNADGSFSYKGNNGWFGADSFTYSVSDGKGGVDTGTITLNVAQADRLPVAVKDVFAFQQGATYTGNLLANDYDLDGDMLVLRAFNGTNINAKQGMTQETVVAGAYGSFVVRPDGTFTYTLNPSVVLAPGASVTETIAQTVTAGAGKAQTTLTMTITGAETANTAPEAYDSTYSLNEDSSLSIALHELATDADGDELTLSIIGGPANGTVSVGTDGRLTYNPNANWYGTDSVTYSVSDGKGGTDTGSVTFDVAQLFDDPTVTRLTNAGNPRYTYYQKDMASDGSFVVFSSRASNLTPGDTNNAHDVFLYNVKTGQTLNITAGGNADSEKPMISASGSTVVFYSGASNLTPEPRLEWNNVFAYDVTSGSLQNLTALLPGGGYLEALSKDGSTVVFTTSTYTPDYYYQGQLIRYDLATGAMQNIGTAEASADRAQVKGLSDDGTKIVLKGNSGTQYLYDSTTGETDIIGGVTTYLDRYHYDIAISGDGSKLVFSSQSPNIVEGDTNEIIDVFLYDIATKQTVSITLGGNSVSAIASISSDGSKIAFFSGATNLTADEDDDLWGDVFLYDVATGVTTMVSDSLGGLSTDPVLTADGSKILFSNLPNFPDFGAAEILDIMQYDLASGTLTKLLSTSAFGEGIFDFDLSSDGSSILFNNWADEVLLGDTGTVPGDTDGKEDLFLYHLI